MKKLILMMTIAVTVSVAVAEIVDEVQIDGLVYSLDTEAKTATLAANWTEPSSIDVSTVTKDNQEYAVVAVGYGALRNCESLTSVSLPNVTTIGDYSFTGLNRLVSVSLPKAILIGSSAFSACPLSSVALPCATMISEGAFFGCSSLASVFLPEAKEIGGSAFKSCPLLLDVSLPNATKVGDYAFEDSGITSISLPNVTTIGNYAFCNAHSLTNVSMRNVTAVGNGAFWGCDSLGSVELPCASEIGQYAFDGCSSLNAICVGKDMKTVLEENRAYYSIGTDVEIKAIPKLTEEQTQTVAWKAKITADNIVLMSGDKAISKEDYDFACEVYGIIPQLKPTVNDFKVVAKDAQLVQEGQVAVSKESIQAAKAETVTVADGMVMLEVGVKTNADITVSTTEWTKYDLSKATLYMSEDKKRLFIGLPTTAPNGFMILQSKDGRIVSEDSVDGRLVTATPWYSPTVREVD